MFWSKNHIENTNKELRSVADPAPFTIYVGFRMKFGFQLYIQEPDPYQSLGTDPDPYLYVPQKWFQGIDSYGKPQKFASGPTTKALRKLKLGWEGGGQNFPQYFYSPLQTTNRP